MTIELFDIFKKSMGHYTVPDKTGDTVWLPGRPTIHWRQEDQSPLAQLLWTPRIFRAFDATVAIVKYCEMSVAPMATFGPFPGTDHAGRREDHN